VKIIGLEGYLEWGGMASPQNFRLREIIIPTDVGKLKVVRYIVQEGREHEATRVVYCFCLEKQEIFSSREL
jgi:hypothetical protein